MESKSSASRTLVWPVSTLGRAVSVIIPPSLWVAVDIPGRLAKAWHVPVPPDPGQCGSHGRARDHGVSVAQSHTHGNSSPRLPTAPSTWDHARSFGNRVETG